MLNLVETVLVRYGIQFLRYDGKMRSEARDAALIAFRKIGGPRVILISTKCGGVGLNLTSANRVDMDAFQQRAAWGIGGTVAQNSAQGIQAGSDKFTGSVKALSRGPAGYISGPAGAGSGVEGAETQGMDSTLRATTESGPREDGV